MGNTVKLTNLLIIEYNSKIKLIQSITYDIGLMAISIILLLRLKKLLLLSYNDAIKGINLLNDKFKTKYGNGVVNIKLSSYILQENK